MNGSGTSSSELLSALTSLGWEFPFERELSLRPLIAFWEETIAPENSIRGRLARDLQDEVRRAPELSSPINDLSVLTRHHELVDALMAAVFPTVSWQLDHAAALIPFELRSFYATPSFERDLTGADGKLQGRLSVDKEAIARFRLLNAYSLALARIYGISFPVDYPIIFTVEDRETGLDRHFKIGFEGRFIDVEPVGTLPALAPDVRARLEARAGDFQALAAVFPPGSVRFRGFTVFRALDVTDQEVLSSLKRDLIDKESIVSSARFDTLQTRLRTLLRRPDLRLGLDRHRGRSRARAELGGIVRTRVPLRGLRAPRAVRLQGLGVPPRLARAASPCSSRTSPPIRTGRPSNRTCWTMASGASWSRRSTTRTPRSARSSSRRPGPGDLNSLQAPRIQEVLPLFSMAVKRSADELDMRVQAFIKEKCTAIHPVVEWRFRKAVFDGLERTVANATAPSSEMEAIVFPDVYPLYAIADIRGSSTQRSAAIQADLLAQLALARDVLRAAHDVRPLPILDQLTHRIDTYSAEIGVSLRSGDEMAIIGFLRTEIEARFDHLQGFGTRVRERIEAYRRAVDPRVGAIYAKRRDFDESVTRITEAISSYIDLEEQAAQAMYPHYFEKQQTDGVDYSIYVGGSLLEEGGFDPLYLKNLRLWQLMVACGVAIRAERLKDQLATPLEVTNLILVQHAPLSIRFRFDEKRFDVDGAYNVRYEIIKKRIDKAVIRGTTERLTQPGQVALVYSHPSEAHEWREYIDYLQTLGYLTREVEELELEELQGAQGLRALRVRVDTSHGDVNTRASLAALPAAEPAPAS